MIAPPDRPISLDDMDALLRFLPIFESRHFSFGKVVPCKKTAPREFTAAYADLCPEAVEFEQALYDHSWVIGFDWGAWSQEARSYELDPEKVKRADLLTLRKLLTSHVRADRFCEGYFLRVLQSGLTTAILRRIAELRQNLPAPVPHPEARP